jgi:hypothetical protein
MPWAGFEPTISVFESAKTFHALVLWAGHCDRPYFNMAHKYYHCCFLSAGYSTALSASTLHSVGIITVLLIILIIITKKYLIYQILSVFINRLFFRTFGIIHNLGPYHSISVPWRNNRHDSWSQMYQAVSLKLCRLQKHALHHSSSQGNTGSLTDMTGEIGLRTTHNNCIGSSTERTNHLTGFTF